MFHSSGGKKFKCQSSWGVGLIGDFESGHVYIHLNGKCSTRAWPPVGSIHSFQERQQEVFKYFKTKNMII